jgi:monoamine oxidase
MASSFRYLPRFGSLILTPAYSYALADSNKAARRLAAPVGNTLFFAGEATDCSGHNGTVRGAIASGQRSATEIANVNLAE